MNKIKCPICNDGEIIAYPDGTYECDNHECSIYNGTHTETFEALIRTRKALDVAVDAIKNATEYLGNQEPLVDVMAMNLHTDLSKALEQITALEQKEVK